MRIHLHPEKVLRTRWYEFSIRFVLGGLITAVAALITRQWGPAIGGLFLAFPAILPASTTLIAKHQREHKQSIGLHGHKRGRAAAAADAAGASMGAIGLVVFSIVAWKLLPRMNPAAVLALATGAWMLTAALIWRLRKAL